MIFNYIKALMCIYNKKLILLCILFLSGCCTQISVQDTYDSSVFFSAGSSYIGINALLEPEEVQAFLEDEIDLSDKSPGWVSYKNEFLVNWNFKRSPVKVVLQKNRDRNLREMNVTTNFSINYQVRLPKFEFYCKRLNRRYLGIFGPKEGCMAWNLGIRKVRGEWGPPIVKSNIAIVAIMRIGTNHGYLFTTPLEINCIRKCEVWKYLNKKKIGEKFAHIDDKLRKKLEDFTKNTNFVSSKLASTLKPILLEENIWFNPNYIGKFYGHWQMLENGLEHRIGIIANPEIKFQIPSETNTASDSIITEEYVHNTFDIYIPLRETFTNLTKIINRTLCPIGQDSSSCIKRVHKSGNKTYEINKITVYGDSNSIGLELDINSGGLFGLTSLGLKGVPVFDVDKQELWIEGLEADVSRRGLFFPTWIEEAVLVHELEEKVYWEFGSQVNPILEKTQNKVTQYLAQNIHSNLSMKGKDLYIDHISTSQDSIILHFGLEGQILGTWPIKYQ